MRRRSVGVKTDQVIEFEGAIFAESDGDLAVVAGDDGGGGGLSVVAHGAFDGGYVDQNQSPTQACGT